MASISSLVAGMRICSSWLELAGTRTRFAVFTGSSPSSDHRTLTRTVIGTGSELTSVPPATKRYLACRPQRIYERVSQARLEHRKDGRRLLFRRSDLDAYLDEASS